MFKYDGQLKTAEFNCKKGRRDGKVIKKCLDIFSFDIEVSSAWMYKGELIGYTPGRSAEFWNDLTRYALPYIWQFSFNDTVYYGREFKDFLKLLDDIPKDMDILVFIHNAAYEFAFLVNLMSVESVFARAPHKPMKFKFKEYPQIEYRCSYMLTNLSLDKWGKQIGIKKLTGYLDYNTLRTPLTPLTDEELAYCERDCIVVYEGIRDHLKTYKDVWDIPLTSTGKVRRVVKKLVTSDPLYMKEVKKTIPKNAKEYKRLKDEIFAGGYTHANRKYLDEIIRGLIFHKDIASSYPAILVAYKFPYGAWAYVGRQIPSTAKFNDFAYIMKLRFRGLHCVSWNTYISVSKSRGAGFIYDNGRVLAADELTITVTEQDYLTILHNYKWDEVECLGCWKCKKRYLPKVFVEYILKLYHDKTALKGVDPDRYMISKQYINSMFGLCVQAIFQSNVDYNDGEWSMDILQEDYINEGLKRLKKWYNKKYFLSYAVGCYVTAYARRRLWECIEYCDKDLIYTDTDSLFYIGDYDFSWFNEDITHRLRAACLYHGIDFNMTRPKDPEGKAHPLGVLEDEEPCEAFRTLGAKKYVEERGGELYLTVAGINKGAVEALDNDINNFCDGFEFNKDHPAVHKLEHMYLTDMKPVTWPDGYKSDLKYGINMRPTGYILSKPDVFKEALDIMETGLVTFSEYFIAKRRGYFNVK